MKMVNRISVVGVGLMGHGIAQTFAQRGYRVRLYDVSKDLVEQAIARIESNLQTFALSRRLPWMWSQSIPEVAPGMPSPY